MKLERWHFGVLFILAVIALVYYLNGQDLFMTFEHVRDQRDELEAFIMRSPVAGILIFSAIYIGAVALSLPIATPLTVLAGFLFGSVLGTAVVGVTATIGATIIFLLARFFFRDFFMQKFGYRIRKIDAEFTTNGFRDVLLLRLAPVVPFVLINVATALTNTKTRDYILATFFGILPFTFVYVNAGNRLAELNSVSDIVSVQTVIAISLLVAAAAVPLVIRHRKSSHRDDDNRA